MKKLVSYLEKVYFIFIVFPIIQMNLYEKIRCGFETQLFRILLIPVLLLTIYLAYLDLKKDEVPSFWRLRWIGFDLIMILFSFFGLIVAFA